MRRVILHVGMHKTGTSSIQASFHRARTSLSAQGVEYAKLGENHSVRIFDAFTENDNMHEQHARLGRNDAADIRRQAAADKQALARDFERCPKADFLISGEGIARLSKAGTERLIEFLRPFFDAVQVVFFVRPPGSYIHSQAQQQIRFGMTLAKLNAARFQVRYTVLKKYFDILPRDNIRSHVFARSTLVDDCAVKTFSKVCALPEVPTVRRNEGLSRPAADLLLVANEILPPYRPEGGPNPARSPRLRNLDLPGPKFSAPRETILRGVAASQADIAWINEAIGERIEAYDDGLMARDFHPGHFAPEERTKLEEQALAENRRLMDLAAAGESRPLRGERRAG